MLLPLIRQAIGDPRLAPHLWISSRLRDRWPESTATLAATGLPLRVYHHRLLRFGLVGPLPAQVLITASDTSERGHYPAYALTRAANRRGLATFTLQHGLENIGLTYRDSVHGANITFAAKAILTWQDPATLPAWVAAETRRKCFGIGRAVGQPNTNHTVEQPFILIGQNLHWHRYDAAYRAAFIEQLQMTIQARPDLLFVAGRHPGQKTRPPFGAAMESLPNFRWGHASLQNAQAIITTPSTVALDAAQRGIPTAVFAGALDLPLYQPLPLLREATDWQTFLRSPASPDRLQAFVAKNVLAGDAVARALDLFAA